jgi:general stress protein 26
VLLIGKMEVNQKNADKDVVWRKGDELYYPKGYDDSDFSVLKFTTEKVKHYSNFKVEEMEIE